MKATLGTALILLIPFAGKPQSSSPTRMPDEVAVFAIQQDGESFVIDPIVVVHYGADQQFKVVPSLNAPTQPNSIDVDHETFAGTFYKPGSALSLFSGGEKIGTATVRSAVPGTGENGGCINLGATISLNSSTPRPLLATNTISEIPGHRSTRRPALASEVAIIRKLGRQWLAENGLSSRLLKRGTTGPVTSTQLRAGGGHAIIGRFDVQSKRAVHRLFAVAEQHGNRYQLTLAILNTQQDLDAEKDKLEIEYLDQLDVDNDGIDEFITTEHGYEGWGYTIWRFYAPQQGWSESHRGSC